MEPENDQRALWNARAATFPRFEEGEDNYEAGMLRQVKELGVDFHGKSVLDVGCGSGMYTIRLARQARAVTALDLSEEMLRILRRDAEALGLANIEYLRSSWMEYEDPRCYEIVFCSMNPAIQDDQSREKLLRHASDRVVFIAFSRRPPSNVMRGLYDHYQITPRRFESAPQMREWLDRRGMGYDFRSVEGKWDVPWQRDDFMRICTLALERYGVPPDQDFLARHVEQFRDEQGRYREKTEFTAEVVSWGVP